METEEAFVYILRCADGALYTGWTNNLARRLAAHNAGTASRCTRARRPVALAYFEPCRGKSDALRREAAIKALPRAGKLALIASADGARLERIAALNGGAFQSGRSAGSGRG